MAASSSAGQQPRPRRKLIRRAHLLIPLPRNDPITPSKRLLPRVVTPVRTRQKEMLASSRKRQEALPMYCFSEQPVCRRLFASPTTIPSSIKGETDEVLDDLLL